MLSTIIGQGLLVLFIGVHSIKNNFTLSEATLEFKLSDFLKMATRLVSANESDQVAVWCNYTGPVHQS